MRNEKQREREKDRGSSKNNYVNIRRKKRKEDEKRGVLKFDLTF